MAYGMGNIAGMLASSGARLGQQIGAPVAQLGQDISGSIRGGMLSAKEDKVQQEAQELIKKYADNPAQLNALGLERKATNDPLADVFFKAAQMATDRRAAQAKADEGRQSRGVQGGLAAITAAARRGIPLDNLQEAQRSVIGLGGTNEAILEAYDKGKPESKKAPKVTTAREKLYNTKTKQMETVEFTYEDGKPINRRVLGVSEKPEEAKPEEVYGLDKNSTEEDWNNALFKAIDSENASMVSRIEEQIKTRFGGPSTKATLDLARAIDPAFDNHVKFQQTAEKLRTILTQGGAGSQELAERELTSFSESDVKAMSALERFSGSKSLQRRIEDGFSKAFLGEYSDITNLEFQAMADAISEYSKKNIKVIADRMYAAGDEDEADKLLDLYSGSEARIID